MSDASTLVKHDIRKENENRAKVMLMLMTKVQLTVLMAFCCVVYMIETLIFVMRDRRKKTNRADIATVIHC